jgi:hypothetical protein
MELNKIYQGDSWALAEQLEKSQNQINFSLGLALLVFVAIIITIFVYSVLTLPTITIP